MYLDLLRREWVTPRTVGERAIALLGHTAAQVGTAMYVVGGRDARRAYNGVWRLDTVSHEWSKPIPTGNQPPPCSKHTMAVQGSRIYVVLGEMPVDRVFIYDTTNDAWLQAEVAQDTPAPPLARAGGCLIGGELTIFGGMDEETRQSSDMLHVLDLPTMSWHAIHPGGFVPSARVGHAACALNAAMFIFGGVDVNGHSQGFAQYDASAMVWESPQLDGAAPGARVGHTMTTTAGGKVYAYGGASGGRPLGDVYVLDLHRSYWEKASVSDPRSEAPPPKVGHACVFIEVTEQGQLAKDSVAYVGSKLLCFGGGDGRQATNEVLLIDVPSLATVTLTPRGKPPQERVGHAMALVRSQLLYVFGGFVRKTVRAQTASLPFFSLPQAPPTHIPFPSFASLRPGLHV